MEHVALDEVDSATLADGIERHGLSEPLDATDVAVNHYRLAPGEGFPGGLHAHVDQEEVFVVLRGEATFETYVSRGEVAGTGGDTPAAAGEVTVSTGEAVRFGPGEYQSGRNESERDLVALALGAPRDTADVRIPMPCPDCGHDDLRLDTAGDALTFVCPDCTAEHAPADCPDCGHDDLRVTLSERDRPVARCLGCGTEFETPPIRDQS